MINGSTSADGSTDRSVRQDGVWTRPSGAPGAEPRWGHARGLQLGLAPLPGPRGLLRIYAPYLGHAPERVINFIAIEPIPDGEDRRGLSELEHSDLDDAPGKRLWLGDPDTPADDVDPTRPSPGATRDVDGIERLVHVVHAERFENGAEIDVRTEFRADRPYEVTLAATARDGSTPLRFCILSATMGNFARLRRLTLRERDVSPAELWPGFERTDFTEHAAFGVDELVRTGDAVVVSAETDETDPERVVYSDDTREGWHWTGRRARQTWRAPDPDPELRAQVNGRWAYWASTSPIPGGTAFENLEVVEPYRPGRELVFSVEPVD